MLTPPLSRREAERLLREPTNDATAPPLAGLATDELAARVIATAACARDLGIALGSDARAQSSRDRPGAGPGGPGALAAWRCSARSQPPPSRRGGRGRRNGTRLSTALKGQSCAAGLSPDTCALLGGFDHAHQQA